MSKETGGPKVPTAIRLRQLRRAEQQSQKEFAKEIGIEAPRLSNLESGYPLSFDVAKKIVAKVPGMSLDWLVYGKEDALPLELRKRLSQAADEPPAKGATTAKAAPRR